MSDNEKLFSTVPTREAPWERLSSYLLQPEKLKASFNQLVEFSRRQFERIKEQYSKLESGRQAHLFIGIASVLVVLQLTLGLYVYSWYRHFDHLVESKRPSSVMEVSGFHARPLEIRKHQKWSEVELLGMLRHAGFRTEVARNEKGSYLLDATRVDSRIRLELEKEGVLFRIVSINHDSSEASFIETTPPYLANLLGKSRVLEIKVPYEELPRNLIDAVIVVEDEDFDSHWGIDLDAIIRAAWVNLREWGVAQGGSTLTQQFVKNFYLSPERTFSRKVKEAFLALLLERKFDKKEIFTLYANHVYLGQVQTYSVGGFGSAAEIYFGKQVRDLTLSESALIAGMIRAPNRYSPIDQPERARERRDLVLSLMFEHELIDAGEYEQAKAETIAVPTPEDLHYLDAPYFLDYVARSMEGEGFPKLLRENTSAKVETTLDYRLQHSAQTALVRGLKKIERDLLREEDGELQGAMLAIDPRTGEVLAMVGGRDYSKSQYNRATDAYRQPGSTFKPFVYAAALSPRINPVPFTAATLLLDAPLEYEAKKGDEPYQPRNYDRQYRGTVNLRNALALSMNAPTVHLASLVGFARVAQFANRLGFENEIGSFPSVALGTVEVSLMELARAYGIFANQGRLVPVRVIRRIEAGGKQIDFSTGSGEQVLDSQTAFLVSSMLQSTLDWGTASAARRHGFELPAAGKTGTSHDSWFVGYTPELLVAVWVGYDDNRELGLTGSKAALPIWTDFMNTAEEMGYLKGVEFQMPEGLVSINIDPDTGMPATPFSMNSRREIFIEGTAPTEISSSIPSAAMTEMALTGRNPIGEHAREIR